MDPLTVVCVGVVLVVLALSMVPEPKVSPQELPEKAKRLDGPCLQGRFFWDAEELCVKFMWDSEFWEKPLQFTVIRAAQRDPDKFEDQLAPRSLRASAMEFMRDEHPQDFARLRTYFERCL